MNYFLDLPILDIIIKFLIALVLGLFLGAERVWAGKTAGMRTYALVSMGSALFVAISTEIVNIYSAVGGIDPTRIASQVIVGVGFIGTGLIFTKGTKLMGLTTATGLWVAAGIGIAVGFGLYAMALIATVLTLFTFTVLWFLEQRVKLSKKAQAEKEMAEEDLGDEDNPL
ncbi:MAG TPA: MgtC/SapB family protein [Candidatus Paceibacterota bacterium]|jgi:putative Mg2+ transporter-C (MgtC) family protein|nr:MgtC/SapB family protein [Candidatus Paceibacterota bacterium]